MCLLSIEYNLFVFIGWFRHFQFTFHTTKNLQNTKNLQTDRQTIAFAYFGIFIECWNEKMDLQDKWGHRLAKYKSHSGV
jgi:hypothetical protein